jgi:hypothetical protein
MSRQNVRLAAAGCGLVCATLIAIELITRNQSLYAIAVPCGIIGLLLALASNSRALK